MENKSNKRMFLIFDKKLYFYRYCNDQKNQCNQAFTTNYIGFFLAHILKKSNLKIPTILLGEWIKKIQEYNTIVISDYAYYPQLEKVILKMNPNCRICFYYMNSIDSTKEKYLDIKRIKSIFKNEVYTYDYSDACKYDINFRITMYKPLPKKNKKAIQTDFIYLGRDKCRGDDIVNFYNIIKDKYTSNIRILNHPGELNCKVFVDYEKYIHEVINSKVILDIVQYPSESITLRALEALFFDKKIITNNIKIANLEIYDLLRDNMLFIDYATVNLNQIDSFMKKRLKKIPLKDKEKYIFENWLENI